MVLKLRPVYDRLRHLYLSFDMNAPLAEQTSHVVQFELTVGCSHNACSYCDLFRNQKYYVKPQEEFREHVDSVLAALKERGEVSDLERIFIGGGDALSVNSDILRNNITYAIRRFKTTVGRLPRRVAVYASVRNILNQSYLKSLHCGGFCSTTCSEYDFGKRIGLELIYLGLETGDPTLLKELNKGYTQNDMYTAFDKISATKIYSRSSSSKIRVSAFVMPGLGGTKHYRGHVDNTIKALNYLKPEFINLMTIKEHPNTRYARLMNKEVKNGTNRRLNPKEVIEQIAEIIGGLVFPTKVGCFDNTVYLGEDTNPIKFPSVDLDGHIINNLLTQELSSVAGGRKREVDLARILSA